MRDLLPGSAPSLGRGRGELSSTNGTGLPWQTPELLLWSEGLLTPPPPPPPSWRRTLTDGTICTIFFFKSLSPLRGSVLGSFTQEPSQARQERFSGFTATDGENNLRPPHCEGVGRVRRNWPLRLKQLCQIRERCFVAPGSLSLSTGARVWQWKRAQGGLFVLHSAM